jgi:NAD(P)-dependent dehydrogenase (short-subunit alcohol dehydrogenase family)
MKRLQGKVAIITGASLGLGRATAVRMAEEGASVAVLDVLDPEGKALAAELTGRSLAARFWHCDVKNEAQVAQVIGDVVKHFGRLDILVNNAGLNVLERDWKQLKPSAVDELIHGNLSSAFYCVTAALPMMRAQKDGILIHTASMAGRFVSPLSGPGYTAAKHGVVAMSHSINMEECINGIRSTVVCPGEVATPILDKRPVPVSAEDRAKMVQPQDCGDLIRYIASLPKHVCINEVLITPTWNRGYVAALQARGVR